MQKEKGLNCRIKIINVCTQSPKKVNFATSFSRVGF